MTDIYDLKDFFRRLDFQTIIIAADGETRAHSKQGDQIIERAPAGGVSTAFDALSLASDATYIARARTPDDKLVVDNKGRVPIEKDGNKYTLKRLFLSEQEVLDYYYGYSNQTLWPLCHIAFERPIFRKEWYEGYINVNKKFARAIEEEIKGKTFVWINDYQLALVPMFLRKPKDTVVGYFWHIPWPNWETFRILPNKRDILWSLLSCDFLGFHRRYQVHNFLEAVKNELEARIDKEKDLVYFDKNRLRVRNLPMGIDTDVIRNLVVPPQDVFLQNIIQNILGVKNKEKETSDEQKEMDTFFEKYQVILGVDRLDYTKGITYRLQAIDLFFETYPQYIQKAIYIGIMAPSRTEIPSYMQLKQQVDKMVEDINRKYQTRDWKPLYMFHESYTREDVVDFYKKSRVCLVTPLDDGMNLVSKEFVIANSMSQDPGMLVLSQFAGSAIDLTAALIVNPYDIEQVARAIKTGLEMKKEEKKERTSRMVELLEERNVYEWAQNFVKETVTASVENKT